MSFGVEGSLYSSARKSGIPIPILLQAYRALGNRVDFQRALRDGDRVTMTYERFRHRGTTADHPGALLKVTLDQQTRDISLYRFEYRDRFAGFFDTSGASVETTLARTPVRRGRVSSAFGRRDHPVLGYTRMHEGLDFAAPRGTPVIAAGDGRIVRAERYGSYGRYVRIRHDTRLSTSYAHLSSYADGVSPGQRVTQGQTIGYVGATGLATGPNLHYEVQRDGQAVDPRRLNLPPKRELEGHALQAFDARRRRFDRFESARLAAQRVAGEVLYAGSPADETPMSKSLE
ncbi:MAG: peptidoglycan DD-metalloendopeptidase family protein [Halofilum sp. (in: g-proteobacteria)]|nr:peptidoglycan DD-metalloendopeptidase family protein [Halofilum sp. (in: g-proteobacteria)]